MCSSFEDSAQMLILPSPFSWAPEQSAEGEAAEAPQPPSSARCRCSPSFFCFFCLWKFRIFFVFPIYFLPHSDVRLKVWSCRQKLRSSTHPWGYISHILLLALLPVLSKKRVQVTRKADSDVPRRLRAPLPKAQRPIFRTLSDKQDLLVEPCSVLIDIHRINEAGGGGWRNKDDTLCLNLFVSERKSSQSVPFCQVNVEIDLVIHHIDIMSHFYTQVGAIWRPNCVFITSQM